MRPQRVRCWPVGRRKRLLTEHANSSVTNRSWNYWCWSHRSNCNFFTGFSAIVSIITKQRSVTSSKLVQQSIWSAVDADREFARIGDSGDTTEIPIVLVPRSKFFFYFALNIPSGPFVLWQQWHRDMGQMNPGVIWFWPAWNRISHIVNRATITYNAPAQNCPTADNGETSFVGTGYDSWETPSETTMY